MKPLWTYTVEWNELVERGRHITCAERFEFETEAEARSAHTFACRFTWPKVTQLEPHVSALYRIDYFVDGNRRTGIKHRRPIAPSQDKQAA